MERIEIYLHQLISWLEVLLPENALSTVVVAIFTAAFGAYAGGRAAQNVSERNKMMNDVVNEMRATNAAISVTFSIINILLNMKEQHIQPLKETFDASRAEFEAMYDKKSTIYTPENPYILSANLQTLELPSTPIEHLQKILFEKTSITGRPLTLVSDLTGAIHSLSKFLDKRNKLINELKSIPAEDQLNIPLLYFGKCLSNGNIDERYPSLVSAIYQYTDHCIMYCKTLTEDLEKHGNNLAEKHEKRFGKHLPKVHKTDFSIPENKGLLPNEGDYEHLKASFKEHGEAV